MPLILLSPVNRRFAVMDSLSDKCPVNLRFVVMDSLSDESKSKGENSV